MNLQSKIQLSLLMLILVSHPGLSQIKESSIGKFGSRLIEIINSNDKNTQLKFVKDNFDDRALEEGTDTWLKKFSDLYSMSEGLSIIDMQPGRDADEVRMITVSKRDGNKIEVATHLSRESATKLMGFVYRPLADRPANSSSQIQKTSVKGEIDKVVDEAVAADKFSGVVWAAKDGKVILNRASGFAVSEKKVLNRSDTKFNMGSMNKMFTSVAIAQLVQAGKISFENKVSDVLPDYPNKSIAGKISIHQLLTHTAGLGDFFKPQFFLHRENYNSLISYLPLFANDTLLFEPGRDWQYSNAGYIVLGLIIEKISGENYFDYVRRYICEPAGMKNTDFYERDAAVENLALGYTFDNGNSTRGQKRHVNTALLPVKGSSAGGGYSTAEDLFSFSKALAEYRLLNEALTKTITAGKVDDHHPNSMYAYGFIDQVKSGTHIVGHNGGGPGINARMSILMDKGCVVIVLSNYDPPSADQLADSICNILLNP